MKFPDIPTDKLLHFLVGYSIAATLVPVLGFGTAFLVVMAVAAGKEVYDWYANKQLIASGYLPTHGVEANDFYATDLGGLAAMAVIWVINHAHLLKALI